MTTEPILHINYDVQAYDCSGYGDNRSRNFTNGEDAVEYAKKLDKRFSPIVIKRITMKPIEIIIYDYRNP